jgi:hypothetical protein
VGERTREERVTFQHAFSFPGVEEQAPGTYVVEIVEEAIDTLSFVAYRRVSTTIVLPSPQFGYASKQVVAIEPHDLAAAQEGDAEGSMQQATAVKAGR